MLREITLITKKACEIEFDLVAPVKTQNQTETMERFQEKVMRKLGKCTDGGTCHHRCNNNPCFRNKNSMTFSTFERQVSDPYQEYLDRERK